MVRDSRNAECGYVPALPRVSRCRTADRRQVTNLLISAGFYKSCGDRIRTCDLEVMSLASYRTAPPRVMCNVVIVQVGWQSSRGKCEVVSKPGGCVAIMRVLPVPSGASSGVGCDGVAGSSQTAVAERLCLPVRARRGRLEERAATEAHGAGDYGAEKDRTVAR